MAQVVLPELGEGIEKATVSYWYFRIGESVKKDEDLVEVTTDKATFNLPSPASGVLLEILVSEGETIEVGGVLGIIEENSDVPKN